MLIVKPAFGISGQASGHRWLLHNSSSIKESVTYPKCLLRMSNTSHRNHWHVWVMINVTAINWAQVLFIRPSILRLKMRNLFQ